MLVRMNKNNKSLTLISHLVVLIVFICLCLLGTWQTNRYFAKDARMTSIAEKTAQTPFTLNEILGYRNEIKDLPVADTFFRLSQKWFWLDNRQIDGQVGYELIIPAETNIGWVLINFGWVKGDTSRILLPEVSFLTTTPFTATGRIVIPGMNRFVTETASNDGEFPKVIQQVDFVRMSEFADLPLRPFMLTLTDDDPNFVRRWTPVVMAAEKHLGYALQWYGLAFALVLIYWRLYRNVNKADAKSFTSAE
jgi:cytochrome oxidase assembly protein ShyY1